MIERGNFNNMLEIKNLTKIYPNGKKAVSDLSITIEDGDLYGFIGKNGAGKSGDKDQSGKIGHHIIQRERKRDDRQKKSKFHGKLQRSVAVGDSYIESQMNQLCKSVAGLSRITGAVPYRYCSALKPKVADQ